MCSSKINRTVTLISTEAEYVAFSACSREVNCVSMFLEEITNVKNPSIIYEDNQGKNFLAKNTQVGICKKHIDIHHHFLWGVVKDKDTYINYIWSEDNPEYIRTNHT